jgi:hypothetical protein
MKKRKALFSIKDKAFLISIIGSEIKLSKRECKIKNLKCKMLKTGKRLKTAR